MTRSAGKWTTYGLGWLTMALIFGVVFIGDLLDGAPPWVGHNLIGPLIASAVIGVICLALSRCEPRRSGTTSFEEAWARHEAEESLKPSPPAPPRSRGRESP